MQINKHNHYWLLGHFRIIASALFILLVFFAGRAAMLLHYGDLSQLPAQLHALLNDLLYGIRFDLKTFAVAMMVPYLVFVVLQLFRPLQAFANQLLLAYCIIFIFVCVELTLINFSYYGVFNNHIDVFIFDFLQPGNTSEVSKTIWVQYPVIRLALLTAVLMAAFYYALISLVQKSQQLADLLPSRHWFIALSTRFIVAAAILFVFALMARGAVTARPLSIGRASLSPVDFFNKLAPNGAYALYDAGTNIKSKLRLAEVDPAELQLAMQNYFPDKAISNPPALEDFLTRTTLTDVRKKPNVVLAIMESMGAKMLNFHSATNNTLGSLAPHVAEDYFFTNFTSAAQSTAMSMEKLLFGHAFNSSISATKYRNLEFATSPAKLFSQQGYRTIFITAGRKSWENVESFMRLQGFDEVYDEYTILQEVNGAKSARTWGVYDEYAFSLAEQKLLQRLQQNSDKPLFIVLLSITNHLPFEPPPDYVGEPVDAGVFKPYSSITDDKQIESVVRTYQYSISALGDFVTHIKDQPALADDTIIAASGDHEIRYLFKKDELFSSWDYRVPFYLYLPEAYKPGTVKDLQRFGSHRDIMPTIYNRIFADTPYFKTGTDLLAEDFDNDKAFSINRYALINNQVCICDYGRNEDFLAWADANFDEQLKLTEKNSQTESLREQAHEYEAFSAALTRLQLKASHYK